MTDETAVVEGEEQESQAGDTLLDKVTEITGLEQNDGESAEDFKARIVRYFADKYPNTDEANAQFDALDGDVTDWVNSATEVVRANRSARSKKRLPELEGLAEDAARARGRPAGSTGSTSTTPRTPREAASAYIVQKALSQPLKEKGYTRVKDRKPTDGEVEYQNGAETIFIKPSDPEQKYISTWRSAKMTDWKHGAKSLREHLGISAPAKESAAAPATA